MVAGNGNWPRQLRESILNPEKGDMVIDVREWYTAGDNRIGILEHLVHVECQEQHKVAIVRKPDGRFETWHNALLIKVPQKPFNATS